MRYSHPRWSYLCRSFYRDSRRPAPDPPGAVYLGSSSNLADALQILEELGENVSPDQVERSLERLEPAFVLVY